MKKSLREFVRKRARYRCEYCRLPEELLLRPMFHVEHILPKQHGGQDDRNNLASACHYCNGYKGPNLTAIDPITNQIVRLFDPRQQAWDEHFLVRGSWIEGQSATGRATVHLFQMNAIQRLELREELTLAGLWPPTYPFTQTLHAAPGRARRSNGDWSRYGAP